MLQKEKEGKRQKKVMFKTNQFYVKYFIVVVGKMITVVCTNITKATFTTGKLNGGKV